MQTFRVSLTLAGFTLLFSSLAVSQTQSAQGMASGQTATEPWNPAQITEPQGAIHKEREAAGHAVPLEKVRQTLESGTVVTGTGAGVTAFIIDTGIRASHSEFSGRVLPGYSVINDGNGTSDCNGHGTHVAGIVGGRLSGVAKQVMLVPVRIMDCAGAGTLKGLMSALEWVGNTKQRPAVANVSVSGPASVEMNKAIAALVAKEVTVVVSAGNNGVDACKASPASTPTVISVGATNKDGELASYSNFGPCVKIFSPGYEVMSAWHTGDNATKTLSGTSMASPKVAGLAALVLETAPAASPLEVATFLLEHASHNRATLEDSSPSQGSTASMTNAPAESAMANSLAFKAMATLSDAPRPTPK